VTSSLFSQPTTIMRPRKPTKKKQELSTIEELSLNLDPTTNDELYKGLFEKLIKKIKTLKEKYAKKNQMSHLLHFLFRKLSNVTNETETIPQLHNLENVINENLSKERRFGKDTRRLVKLVARAFQNPSEF